jgi:hypothetical protein
LIIVGEVLPLVRIASGRIIGTRRVCGRMVSAHLGVPA